MSDTTKATIKEKKLKAKKEMTKKQYKACHKIIHSATAASAAAGAIPIPIADAVPISVAQVAMVIALGNVFGKKLGRCAALGILAGAAGTYVGRTVVKLVPVVGWVVSAVVAAGVTEAIGWSVAVDFKTKTVEDFYREGYVDASALYEAKLFEQAKLFAEQKEHWATEKRAWKKTDTQKDALLDECLTYIADLEMERDALTAQNKALNHEKQELLDGLYGIRDELNARS